MKNLKPIRVTNNEEREEREEIKKMFNNQTNLLLGLIAFAEVQFFIILAYL